MTQPLAPARSSITRLTIDPAAPAGDVLDRAAEQIREGQLVVAPTETRYGLLANATGQAAVTRLCEAKGRAFQHPVSVFVASLDDLARYGEITPAARTLAERFLPGPLTLVLRCRVNWAAPLAVAGKTGFRISPSPVIRGLLDRVGAPLTATSANLTGRPEESAVAAIEAQLGDAVACYLDAGLLEGAVSTVIDCSEATPKVLRESAISSAAIAEVVKLEGNE